MSIIIPIPVKDCLIRDGGKEIKHKVGVVFDGNGKPEGIFNLNNGEIAAEVTQRCSDCPAGQTEVAFTFRGNPSLEEGEFKVVEIICGNKCEGNISIPVNNKKERLV